MSGLGREGTWAVVSKNKKREVLELLRGYRAFHTPFGGAMPLDETGVIDASYGPSGFVEEGQYHPNGERQRLKASYDLLKHAITLVKGTPEGFIAWVLLHEPYFGDPGDPSVVAHWREKSPNKAEYHDMFVDRLAEHLKHKDLFVAWPHRMTVREEKLVERRNDEVYAEYRQIKREKRDEGLSEAKANKGAVEMAAVRHGYSPRRVYEIVSIRETESA